MEEKVFNRNLFIKIACTVIAAIGILSMTVMMVYASKKVVIITAEASEETGEEAIQTVVENEMTKEVKNDKDWKMAIKSTTDDGIITITCPEGVECFDVEVEERILEKSVRFLFPSSDSSFFIETSPRGDFSEVSEVRAGQDGDDAVLSLALKEVKRPVVSYSGGKIIVSFDRFSTDKPVVIIDPRHGGASSGTIAGTLEEKKINLEIALKVRELALNKPYEVLVTRTGDYYLSTEARLEFVEYFDADYYIGINLNADAEDTRKYGMSALYNENFFRDGFENVDWADAVLRASVESTINRGNGLEKNEDTDVILTALTIPATVLRPGTITNPQEAKLLSDPQYVEKIASGIIEAIDGVIKQ